MNLPGSSIEDDTSAAGGGWYRRIPPEVPIFLFYLLVTIFLTWPVLVRFTTSIYGYRGDNVSAIWSFWWVRSAGAYGSRATFTPLVGYPFGSNVSLLSMEFIADLTDRFFLLFLNEVATYNLQILASFFLSGITMYYLVRYVTKDRRVAFFGGLAYMIGSYHAYHSMFILRLAFIQWMPLYILALLKFLKKPDVKRGVLVGLAWVLVAATSIHYGLFMVIFTAAFLIGRLAYKWIDWKRKKPARPYPDSPLRINRKTALISLMVILGAAMIVLPPVYIQLNHMYPPGNWPTYVTAGQARHETGYYFGSARLLEYAYPSPMNPVLGWITNDLRRSQTRPFGNSLYIGWSLVVLAIMGFVLSGSALRKQRRQRSGVSPPAGHGDEHLLPEESDILDTSTEQYDRRVEIWGLTVAGLAALVLSLQPYFYIGATKLFLPSYLFKYFASWFRWYMRLAIVVNICVVLLACIGLLLVFREMRTRHWELILAVLFVIVAVEMLIVPPFQNFDFSHTPNLFTQVEHETVDGGLVFYPAQVSGMFNTSTLLFYQRDFKKPMLNAAADDSDGEALRRTVYNPYNPAVPSILARFSIHKMVFMDTLFSQYEGFDAATNLVRLLPRQFVLEKRVEDDQDNLFGTGNIYNVEAEPALVVPIYQGNITEPHMDAGLVTVRLMNGEGILNLVNYAGGPVTIDLELPIANVGTPRAVKLKNGDETLSEVTLKLSREEGRLTAKGFVVPKQGVKLNVVAEGPASPVGPNEVTSFGTETASISMGDLVINTVR